jgi:hypothetical protein
MHQNITLNYILINIKILQIYKLINKYLIILLASDQRNIDLNLNGSCWNKNNKIIITGLKPDST